MRTSYTQMAGFFAIIVGIMIFLMALMMLILKQRHQAMINDKVKWNPAKEMKSRGITVQSH